MGKWVEKQGRVGIALGVLALSLAACGRVPAQEAVALRGQGIQEALRHEDAALPARLNPDSAQEKAMAKAKKWRSDARLISVSWAVAKVELASVLFHLFHSPKGKDMLLVETKLVSFWQKERSFSDPRAELAFRLLAPVEQAAVGPRDALAIAKAQQSSQGRPVSLLTLFKPTRLLPPLWAATADELKILIHANTGKVLLKGEIDVPYVPFMGGDPAHQELGKMLGPLPEIPALETP